MKNKILTILIGCFVLWSCEDALKQPVKFNVTASTDEGTISGDAFVVDSGKTITFNFTGDPDFITFYSGESGHEYVKRNLVETPAEEITSTLKFNAKPQYGIIEGTLKVYLSTTFEGLRGYDKLTDSLAVIKNQWTDISASCNLPTLNNGTVDVALPLNDYMGKKLTVAFQYITNQNTSTQPTWIISGLQIENTLKSSGAVSAIKASNMGFQALDMLALTAPYKNTGGSGIWNLSNIATEIRIQSSPSGSSINDDWVISNPLIINSRLTDKGVAIKKMSMDLDAYNYTFNKKGKYIVTFLAKNANFESSNELIRQFEITVK